jgi:predicted nucleotide-binding protein
MPCDKKGLVSRLDQQLESMKHLDSSNLQAWTSTTTRLLRRVGPTLADRFRALACGDIFTNKMQRKLRQTLCHAIAEASGDRQALRPYTVFIVHGRNINAFKSMDRFVQSLGLKTLDFNTLSHELSGAPFVGDVVREGISHAQAVIVIFTPDEKARLAQRHWSSADLPSDRTRWQARPNVLFESGLAFGINPRGTILVTLGTDVTLFSDVNGRHLTPLDNSRETREILRARLISADCAVDTTSTSWEKPNLSGDFVACLSARKA